jgi:hypothetical protein
MDKELYMYIISEFEKAFKDINNYIFEYDNYEDYFTLSGNMDKRKSYFKVTIALPNLTRSNILINLKIIGNALVKISDVMKNIKKEHRVIFKECKVQDNNSEIVIKFNTLKREVKRSLLYYNTSNFVVTGR